MLAYKKIVDQLIQIRKSDAPVIAACVYGSQVQGTATDNSDLDIYLITGGNENIRGMYFIDGIYVDYFEKSFITIMNEIEKFHKVGNSFYASFMRNSEVIFDRTNIVAQLKNYQLQIEKLEIRDYGLTEKDYSTLAYYYSKFNQNRASDEPFFDYYYYIFLEQLRQKYHKINHYSPMYAKDVPVLYQNESKANTYCLNLPDSTYRDFFLECISQEKCSRKKKEQQIEQAIQFLGEDLEHEQPKTTNPLRWQSLNSYLISFFHESRQLINASEESTFLYRYFSLVENIRNLNSLYQDNAISQLDSSYLHQLIVSQDPILTYFVMQDFCNQSGIDSMTYEISYFQKKYRN